MKYIVSVRKNAEKDIEDAYNWYEDTLKGLGEAFLKDLERCYLRLENSATSFSNINNDLRQVSLRKFPFVLVFEIRKNRVIVYSVFHTSKNPLKKLKKK